MPDSEKRIYYDIMTKCWNAFKKDRPCIEFSDDWWKLVIGDFDMIRTEYKDTEYAEYCGRLTQLFLDEHERRGKQWQNH